MQQTLSVMGNTNSLGQWQESHSLPMNFEGNDDYWTANIYLSASDEPQILEYKYIVNQFPATYIKEPYSNHKLFIAPVSEPSIIEVADTFRWKDDIQENLSTSAFSNVLFRRNDPVHPQPLDPTKTSLEFIAFCPHIRPNQALAVVGSIPALGNWDPTHAIKLVDGYFPVWSADVDVPKDQMVFEYKYIIINQDNSVLWEADPNRFCSGFSYETDIPRALVLNEWFVCPNHDFFKGFGIYCPIFSLRSNYSCGIGQYTDLIPLIDFCNKIRASLIHILPIHDTTETGGWGDSYPYKQVSCFALNPMYINLYQVMDPLPKEAINQLNDFRTRMEKNPTIDYPAVYDFKHRMLDSLYQLVQSTLKDNVEYQKFIAENNVWLRSYALFCYFRDFYNRSDFHFWPHHSNIKPSEIIQLSNKYAAQLDKYYWYQYLCEIQYKSVLKYAEEHRVIINGDLPTGVNFNSVECWAYPKNFRLHMCAGSTPDDFSSDGQNWGFPTIDWDYMASDDYKWWRNRLARVSQLFHAVRIDHILGFFRIWELPRDNCIRGILGHYYPIKPVSRVELETMGLWNIDRYVKPYVRWHLLVPKFGGEAEYVAQKFFIPKRVDLQDDWFDFKDEYNTEKKIADRLALEITDKSKREHYQICLFQLLTDVLLIPDDNQSDYFHVRTNITVEHIEVHNDGTRVFYSPSWNELNEPEKTLMLNLYNDYTFKRQNKLWVQKAKPKLDLLKSSTNTMIIVETAGHYNDDITTEILSHGFLSVRIQRIGNEKDTQFDDVNSYPYLSVCCPSTHDTSSLRGWWEENSQITLEFWNSQLWKHEEVLKTCEPMVSQMIIRKHLWSPSMWAVFLLQDLTGIDESLRRQNPIDERINIPSDPNHHWYYRYPYKVEELRDYDVFTSKVREMVESSHRF